MVPPRDGKSGMNGVAVARHGLIFGEDVATGSRKVFRGLWGLWDCIFISKMTKILETPKNIEFRFVDY